MAQTTTTTETTAIPTELIAAEVIEEARPFNIVAPLVLNKPMPDGTGKVMSIPKLPTTTAAGVTEASDIVAVARTTGEGNVTVAEVGLSTDLTKLASKTAKLPDQLLMWARSQGRAIAQKVTGDLCALFSAFNGSTAVGTSGTNITVANFVEAMYTLDAANAPGMKNAVLHPRQVADLFNAISASTGAAFSNVAELVRQGQLPEGTPAAGFIGLLFGVPIYQTTEVPTANSSADYSGGMFTQEAAAYVELWGITVEYDTDVSARATEIIVTACYGVAEIVDGYGVPIETDA